MEIEHGEQIKSSQTDIEVIGNSEIIASIDENAPPEKKIKTLNDNDEKPDEKQLLSKRQRKKLLKMKQWEEIKLLKRQREREKYKQKRLEAIEKGEPTRTGPSRKELKRKQLMQSENKQKIIIDLDFDELMSDRDITKCVKQLLRIYTVNRRSESPVKLIFTGIKKDGKIHKCLKRNDGYENWDIQLEFDKSYNDCFEKESICYLTSDSDNLLEKLDDNCVYIIGGIVDHNHQKGLCFDRAQKLNIKTARLPLNEHVDIKTRTVLSTFHVFEILLGVSQGKSWTSTILETLPMRKGAKVKETTKDDSELTSDLDATKDANS